MLAPSRSGSKQVVFWFCTLVLMLLAVETLARLGWMLDRRVPFFAPGRIIEGFYKQLPAIIAHDLRPDDGYFDVLLLGGSVISRRYTMARILHEQLNYHAPQPARIHNAAHPAHTSLDSWYKYQYLQDKHFDLVMVYHGINETRTNNCPPAVFKHDYSHQTWYRFIHSIEAHSELPMTILPYSLHFLWLNLQERLGSPTLMPFRRIRPEWVTYGSDIKTAATFRRNMTRIIHLARQKREPVLLMTFASYIAEGYTKDKFLANALDYTLHKKNTPIEVWGTPVNVAKGLAVHNAIARELAGAYAHVSLLDQAQRIPPTGKHYLDICHLTVEGSVLWADNVMRHIDALGLHTRTP